MDNSGMSRWLTGAAEAADSEGLEAAAIGFHAWKCLMF